MEIIYKEKIKYLRILARTGFNYPIVGDKFVV